MPDIVRRLAHHSALERTVCIIKILIEINSVVGTLFIEAQNGKVTMAEASGFQVQQQGPHFYESEVSLFMTPFVEALVNASVSNGETILDVACGTGFAARAASKIVGQGGRVVGSDLNPGMVAMAQSVPHSDGCEITWQQASALELPFQDSEFDAVVSQQGIQFFPDVPSGLREMARVTKPGGRIAATVWAPRETTPYLHNLFDVLTMHCEGDAGANAGWQAAGGENQIKDWFDAAGLANVEIRLVEATISLPPISKYVVDHLKALPPPSVGRFFDMSDPEKNEVIEVLEERLENYRTKSGFEVPFHSYLAMATL